MDKKLFRSIVVLFLIAALFALAVIKIDTIFGAIGMLLSILTPVIAGTLIALFLDRPYILIRRLFLRLFKDAKHKYRLATGLSVAVTYLLLLAFIAVFLVAVIPEVTSSVSLLLENLSTYTQNIEKALNGVIEKYDFLRNNMEPLDFSQWEELLVSLISNVTEIVKNRLPEIFNITKSIAGGVTNAILSLIISIYIMLGRTHLKWQAKKAVYAFCPEALADKIREVANLTAKTLSGYISGRVVDSIVVGIICFVFLKIFGFDYAALISFIIGVTNIIPMLGPFIGAIPSAFLLLLVNPAHCFWFIIFIIVLQQVDSNVIDPRIAGESTGLPTLWVLVSITLGGGLFGFLGFILSVPLCAVLYTLVKKEVSALSRKKGIPLDDEPDKDPVRKRRTFKELYHGMKKKKASPSEDKK